jgi:hypothetical protein
MEDKTSAGASAMANITCKETIRMICEYLEGRLSMPVKLAMQRHITRCPHCRLVHDAAQHTLEAYFDRHVALEPTPKVA